MEFNYKGRDNNEIHVYKWKIESAKGVVQIIHGMQETGSRYEHFARFLNDKGFSVYADDHRGHGKSSEDVDKQGRIGIDGLNGIVEDEKILFDLIKKENPKIPLFVISHSMGSFVGQEFITRYGNEIDGIVLSGTAGKFGLDAIFGTVLAKIQIAFKGEDSKAYLIEKIAFGGNNKKIENPKTSKDWISSDPEQVQKYINDPYCGAVFPANFYYEFFKFLSKLHRKEKIERIPKKLPIFILGGEMDPVGKYGKSIGNLYKLYKMLGVENLAYKLYLNGRHEMLNERNREEVYKDIWKWLRLFAK